jgi:hypothetical protein
MGLAADGDTPPVAETSPTSPDTVDLLALLQSAVCTETYQKAAINQASTTNIYLAWMKGFGT